MEAVTDSIRAHLIFSGSGPILVLTTYKSLDDAELLAKLRHKGILKFIAYEIPLDVVGRNYGEALETVVSDLRPFDDLRVLDFDGHQIMSRFNLDELGTATKHRS